MVTTKADLMHTESSILNENTIITDKVIELTPETDPDWIFGVVSSKDGINEAIQPIKNREKYKTVVILAPTEYRKDDKEVFTYDSIGILDKKGVKLDSQTIHKFVDSNLVESLGSINEFSFWNDEFMKILSSEFPEASFIPISINKDLAEPQIEAFGYGLKSHLPKESIVFSITEFLEDNDSKNKLITKFQKDYSLEVINSADFRKFKNLPVKNSTSINILSHYLLRIGAKNPTVIKGEKDLKILFKTGDPKAKQSEVYLVAFGDIMLGRYVRTLMDINGLDYPFKKMDESYLKVNDMLLANLEGPVTTKAIRTSSGMSFGFFPDTAKLLKKHHFDVLSQANNHTFDKRLSGYEESLNFLRQEGLIAFGNPNTVTGNSTGYVHIRGQKFAFFGLEEVNTDFDNKKALEEVKKLVKKGYKVIVYPHWGVEYVHSPNKRQIELAHSLIDEGAYAIIGHHPHVVQTYENYKGHPIFYSLGNAIFDQYWSEETQIGLSIAIKMNDEKIEMILNPIYLHKSQMRLMNNDERKKFLERFITWKEYSEDEKKQIRNGIITIEL